MQKKETLRLRKYETAILNCSKSYLMKLEKVIKRTRITNNPVGAHALACLCDLLVAHPQFNYAPNIIKLVVPYLDCPSEDARFAVRAAFERLFAGDKRGEISLVAVRHIKSYVKSRKYACRAAAIECLLKLRLQYVDVAAAEEEAKRAKKRREEMSKKERKRHKQLQKVEKEMLEAKGEESRQLRNRNFTEVSKAVFEMLFRIIKAFGDGAETAEVKKQHQLLSPALRCISAFGHTINVDFFDDLLRVLSGLLRSGALSSQSERLLCVKTAFDILTGPGEFLTYDPGYFTQTLYEMLPRLDLNVPGCAASVCSVLRNMLVRRKKLVSRDTVQAFAKAVSFAALQMDPEDARAFGETLQAIKSAHLRTFEALLDNEEHVPGKVSSYSLGDLNVGTLSLWELNLLTAHYEKPVVDACRTLTSISQ